MGAAGGGGRARRRGRAGRPAPRPGLPRTLAPGSAWTIPVTRRSPGRGPRRWASCSAACSATSACSPPPRSTCSSSRLLAVALTAAVVSQVRRRRARGAGLAVRGHRARARSGGGGHRAPGRALPRAPGADRRRAVLGGRAAGHGRGVHAGAGEPSRPPRRRCSSSPTQASITGWRATRSGSTQRELALASRIVGRLESLPAGREWSGWPSWAAPRRSRASHRSSTLTPRRSRSPGRG